ADQKQRVLIVTDGSSPVQIWERGNFFELTPKQIEARNPLGAGDRFLTAFMVASQAGSSVRSAGEFALEHVGRILETQLDTKNTRANLVNTFDTP
ncbi:MAG: PfkB family carbohydrate kinase, partial [Candidatus Uhrbacteria bacterium]|nr:PfkB family carbohydrate kinase [Candidatus Uhrbacteria bacterium]